MIKTTFKAKYGMSHYKSEESWLNQVYRNNKEKIDEKINKLREGEDSLGLTESNLKTFKQSYYEQREEGLSPKKAMESLSRTSIFMEKSELLRTNAINGLQKEKEAWRQFRNLVRHKGRFVSIDSTKFHYVGDRTYVYKDPEKGIDISIIYNNSPEVITIQNNNTGDEYTYEENY